MLFFLRKLVATAITPSLWGFGAIAVGVVMLLFARTRRAGQVFVLWGSVWLVVLGLGYPFDIGARWLEDRHPPLLYLETVEDVRWIVVLGGGHRAEARLPPSAYLNESSVFRAVEGARLSHRLPESTLLFTGYGGDYRRSAAAVGADFARSLGVDPARIALVEAPRTTGEEARAVRELAESGPVILVTSATHMARAVRLFEREGVAVIPAPTGHRAVRAASLRSGLSSMPHRIALADAVAHELVGLAVLRWQ